MNKDAEAIKQLFAWLLQESDPAVSEPSGKDASRQTSPDETGALNLQPNYLDPLDSEEVSDLIVSLPESGPFAFRQIPSLEFGDIPAVQDRFHALLKRRLRAEIERNPPRFPWETESFNYEIEYTDWSTPDLATPLWTAQLQSLNLPVPMPDQVLAKLFEQCCTVVQSSLQEGAKLVQAVEALFPGEAGALNHLAGMVLSAPARSGKPAAYATKSESSKFPSHYDAATPTQQMALSLIAAQELLEAMSLKLSPAQSTIERSWLTDLGALKLYAEYLPETQQIRIQADMPAQGHLQLRSAEAQSTANCSGAGRLGVELLNLQPHQPYLLEVQLGEAAQPPLVFVCSIAEA
ncbi:MAG: hypothetical protein Kow00121_44510 [Elainellaceae cyanobacterium]